jgi:hypothetical protein
MFGVSHSDRLFENEDGKRGFSCNLVVKSWVKRQFESAAGGVVIRGSGELFYYNFSMQMMWY